MKKQEVALITALFTGFILAGSVSLAGNGQAFTSAGDLDLSAQHLSSATVGGDLLLHDVTVEGRLAAGRNITCSDCSISGSVMAGHNVELSRCNQVQSITSGHNTNLTSAHVLTHVASGHDVNLDDVTVDEGLQVGNALLARRSTIRGVLALGGHNARLDQSTAAEIRFSNEGNQTSILSGNRVNSGIVIGNSVIGHNNSIITGGGSIIRGMGRGGSHVSVGPGSLSSVNGYTIKGTDTQTTVITPDQSIYVNGRRVSGNGPSSYADYATQNASAPHVQGPGWTESPASAAKTSDPAHASQGPAENVLELVNNSTVTGTVVFESGYGEVRVERGSQFSGKVINGRVAHL